MGLMSRTELRDATRWALDNKQNITTDQLDRWVNWSYLHVSMPRIHKHRSLQFAGSFPLVTDQVPYPLHTAFTPTVLWGIHSVVYINGTSDSDYSLRRRRLRQTDIRFLDEQVLGQGEPSEYTMYGGNFVAGGNPSAGQTLYLNHRPGTNENGKLLLVRGWRQPPILAAGEETVLDVMWDEAIVLGATWRGWRELGRPERAEPTRLAFGAMISEIQSADQVDADDWGTRMEIDLSPYQVERGSYA